MATAVPVILSGPSGQRIYGGAFPPGGGGTLGGAVVAADVLASGTVSAAAPAPAPSPSPAAPSGAMLLRPMSTWSGAEPWTTGHVFAPGEIAAAETVGAAGGTVQVDVRTRYADGSLRFAVLSGVTTQADIALLRNGTPASGTSIAEPSVTATVAFANVVDAASAAVGGGSFTASLATAVAAGITAWNRTTARKVRQIFGPVMSEFHYFVPTADAHTHVWFYVRAYSSGAVEVETVVENGWLQVAAPGRRTYDVTVTVAGTVRYTGTGIQHYHHTRWSRVDWAGTAPTAAMAQSVAHLRGTGMAANVVVNSLTATAYSDWPQQGTKFTSWTRALAEQPAPFAEANADPSLGSGGDTDNVGAFPHWEMVYLAEGDSRAYFSVIGNMRSAGRYCLHYRDEATGLPVESSRYPSLTMPAADSGISDAPGGSVETPAPSGGTPPVPASGWAFSHGPKYGYLTHLLTGRWSALETTQFYAATGGMAFKTNWLGYRVPPLWTQLRTTAHLTDFMSKAALITPTHLMGVAVSSGADYAHRLEVQGRWDSTLDYHWNLTHPSGTYASDFPYMASARDNAFGVFYMNSFAGDAGTVGLADYSGMQQAYMRNAWYFATVAETPSTDTTKRDWLAQFSARHDVGLMGATPTNPKTEWRLWSYYATEFATGLPGATHTFYASWAAWETAFLASPAFRTTAGFTAPPVAGVNSLYDFQLVANERLIRSPALSQIDAGGSAPNAMTWAMALMHEAAGKVSIPGADLAASRFYNSDTFINSLTADSAAGSWRNRPGCAVRSRRVLPAWVPAAGECVELQGAGYVTNTFISQAPSPSVGPDADAFRYVIDAYSGGGYNPHYITAASPFGAMFFHGGGHGNSNDNSTTVLKMGQSSLTFERLDNPTFPLTLGTDEANWAEHQDGRPYSAHTADCMVVVPPSDGGGPMGSLVRVMTQASGSAVWRNPLGGAGDTVDSRRAHAFNFATETWSRFGSSSGLPGGSIGPYAVTAYDPDLQRIWFVQSVNETNCPTLSWINVLDGSRGSQACTSPTFAVDTATMRFVKTGGKRLLVMCGKAPSSDIIRMNYIDLDAIGAAWLGATLSATIPCTYHNSFDWAAPKSRFYVFTGSTATGVYEVAAPATLTDTWTVTARTFTNSTTMTSPASSPAKRWSYVEQADCFVYVPRAGSLGTCAVYAYRPH